MPIHSRLTADRGALLVVDLQTRLVPAIRDADRVIANTLRLVRAAQLLGLPTFATEQVPSKLGPTIPRLAELLPDRLPKTTFHAGGAEGLWALLEMSEVRHVALVGIEAHVCVAQTAIELAAKGYEVQIPIDAVGSRFPTDRKAALHRLERSGIIMTTTEAILFEWVESADHPRFREISAIVKERTTD